MQSEKIIKESWRRCAEHGLTQSEEPILESLPLSEIKDLSQIYRELVVTTNSEVLPYYQNILSNANCLIILTDNNGFALNSWGDKRFLPNKHKPFFEAGVDWNEKFIGTNAIGTSLVTGKAIQVQRDEHYFKINRFMVGSAAPIYDANRQLIGMLDITSDSYLPQAHTLGLVKLMSQGIENRLLFNQHNQNHYIFTFNTNAENVDSQWSGLIIFDDIGRVVAANNRAETLLKFELLKVHIEDILNVTIRDLRNQPEGIIFEVTAVGKYKMYGQLKRPVIKLNLRNKSKREEINFSVRTESDVSNDSQSDNKNNRVTLYTFSFGDPFVDKQISQAKRIVNKALPILVHGETGVGKEVFVQCLHNYSVRQQFPLVAVNCAAIPNDLVESELFGYEKGAFTGANVKGSIGLIRKANGGTLFLDEIGEMPLNVQGRLLRVLQERTVTPLGSTESYEVDIKLVSATNRDLKKEIDNGNFRQDLFYRVSGLNIHLPPLRERRDRRQLFQQVNALQHGSELVFPLSDKILNLFNNHPWPGNVRQLISVLQIAQAMADNEPIQEWHLPEDFLQDVNKNDEQTIPVASINVTSENPSEIAARKKSNDKDELISVYTRFNGNKSKTAAALGISRNTLYKRLREIGLS